jgi:hypothetical protein
MNLRKLFDLIMVMFYIRSTDGVSYNINTGEFNPSEGFMVALEGHEEKYPVITKDTVSGYIVRHSEALSKDNAFFGCWYDGENYILDVSENYSLRRDAVFYAIVRNQTAYYDCASKQSVRVNVTKQLVKS